MNSKSLFVAVLAGITSAAPLEGRAEGQAEAGPAYLVVEVNVKDQKGFADYAEKATQTVAQYGGTFIVMDGDPQTVEGADPNGNVVIIQFDSVADANTWLNSPEYNAVKVIRHRTADTRQYLVEGLPAGQP